MVICHFTPPCAWASVVGVPRPSDWPGLGEGDCSAGTRLTVVWRFRNPAITSRAGAYARSAASTSRSDAATASAHLAGADLLWTGGRIRRRGVAGQSITAARSVRSCSRSGTRGLLHQRPQTREGARQPRLHGALRDSQCGGGLLAVELEEIAGCDDDPVVVAKRVDHREKSSALVTGDDHRLGGWGRIPRAEVLGQPELEPVNPSRRTRSVASLVGDDAQKPRLQRSSAPKAIQRAKGLDEPLLRGVLRVGGGPCDDVGGAERDLLVALHDLLVGGPLSALGAHDQGGIVVLRPALHRNASSTPRAASWFPATRQP